MSGYIDLAKLGHVTDTKVVIAFIIGLLNYIFQRFGLFIALLLSYLTSSQKNKC